MAGVDGMNFVDGEWLPTIPELMAPKGYMYFWLFSAAYLVISCSLLAWFWVRTERKKPKPMQDMLWRRGHSVLPPARSQQGGMR